MAGNTIKGLTIEIGGDTTKLGKALEEVNKKSRDLSSELGEINKLLKMDPGNADLLAQKQKVLADAVANTKEKLDKLKKAEKQVQKQFEKGEASEEQVRALQREIVATSKKLDGYEKAAKETAEAIENLGKESDEAGDEIERVGDQADKTEKKADDLGETLSDSTGVGFAAVAALATAAVGAIVGCVEASEEYRRAMGKLDTAFQSAGHSSELATATYKTLQSVIGETDQAVEASQQIALLANSEQEAAEWAGYAAGVIGRFGDALQPETFFEAANETIKLGAATGAYAQMLEGTGYSVDEFNMELAQFSSVSEKQQYMLRITKMLLGDAALKYNETNAEVIRSNQANEEWNATLAEIGGEMAPLVTEVKRFGTSLLENAKEPLKEVATFISDKLLPGLENFGGWVANNGPVITATIVGTTAAFVAYKAAVVAAEISHKGFKGAIMASTTAQKLFNLAQAATPWGLVATALAGVVAGIIAYEAAVVKSKQPVDVLTEEEKELAASADEAAAAFREQKKATNETLGDITAQMSYTQSLADELRSLADASGKVKEKDQERVAFILNELNQALGTEYSMVDGVIQKYGELKTSIDEVIESKLANALLEAAQADYVTAQQEKADALQNLMIKEKEYEAQQAAYKEFYDNYVRQKNLLEDQYQQAQEDRNGYGARMAYQKLNLLESEKKRELGFLEEKENAYNQAATDYGLYSNTIMDYEEAQTAVLTGNYSRAVDILSRKGRSFGNYSDKVDEATARALDSLFQEAVDAGIAAERTKKNFESGVEGFTKEMVDEAEQGYQEAMDAYANAYADAEGVGKDLGDGLSNGMESKRFSLLEKAKSLVKGIISAMKKEADSHSPSKKTMSFGEDIGEGAEIGIENKTKDVARAAQRQVGAVLEAYRAEEAQGSLTLRDLTENQTARQVADSTTITEAYSDKLDKILGAIERGQILTIDGNALVGATASRMDNALGQRRALAARGAI